VRLFIAAELPVEVREALAETSASLRDAVRGRYVGSDLFHVTLAFLGEVPSARIGEIEALLAEATRGHAPFEVTLGPLGSFGRARRAVLWQGFERGRDGLDALAADVRASLAEAGFAFDGKGFLPHVTLMREANLTGGSLPVPVVESGTLDTVTLFSSDLSGPRPRYEALARVALTGTEDA
jgi:2'-5' RNA ligase